MFEKQLDNDFLEQKRTFVLRSIGSADRNPDWAPDKLSSFGPN